MIYKALCKSCGVLLKSDNAPFTLDPNPWANTGKPVCWFCGCAHDNKGVITWTIKK